MLIVILIAQCFNDRSKACSKHFNHFKLCVVIQLIVASIIQPAELRLMLIYFISSALTAFAALFVPRYTSVIKNNLVEFISLSFRIENCDLN